MSVLEANGPVRFAAIDIAPIDIVDGNVNLVEPIPGRKIRVLALAIIADGEVAITFKSGPDALTGPLRIYPEFTLAAETPWGCFEAEEGKPLVLGLSAANQVSGWLSYQEVK